MKAKTKLTIKADARPLMAFLEFLQLALQSRERPLRLRKFGFEDARIECDYRALRAGEMTVRFYPSDAFLRDALAACARDVD